MFSLRPSYDELKDLWLYSFARSSLIECSSYLAALPSTPDGLQAVALIEAAVIAYARPFSKWQVAARDWVVPLRDVDPPAHLLQNHKDALAIRNTMIGHKDATPAQSYGTSPNIVLMKVNAAAGTVDFHATATGGIEEHARTALLDLCTFYVQHCETMLRPITSKYLSEIRSRGDGHYELVVSEPPNDWIKPWPGSP